MNGLHFFDASIHEKNRTESVKIQLGKLKFTLIKRVWGLESSCSINSVDNGAGTSTNNLYSCLKVGGDKGS